MNILKQTINNQAFDDLPFAIIGEVEAATKRFASTFPKGWSLSVEIHERFPGSPEPKILEKPDFLFRVDEGSTWDSEVRLRALRENPNQLTALSEEDAKLAAAECCTGAIAVPHQRFHRKDDCVQLKIGSILVSFNGCHEGAMGWQDFYFATVALSAIETYFNSRTSERISMNYAAFRDYPAINFWLTLQGMVAPRA